MPGVKFAAISMGSVLLGAAAVLLSVAPSRVETQHHASLLQPVHVVGDCPPCNAWPLDAEGWLRELDSPEGGQALEQAAGLSRALPAPQILRAALSSSEPGSRALAVLLLNLESERLPGCTPVDSGTALELADKLDREVSAARAGHEPASLSDLVMRAASVNRGSGLPAGCAP